MSNPRCKSERTINIAYISKRVNTYVVLSKCNLINNVLLLGEELCVNVSSLVCKVSVS